MLDADRGQVKIGIEALAVVSVHRQDVCQRVQSWTVQETVNRVNDGSCAGLLSNLSEGIQTTKESA